MGQLVNSHGEPLRRILLVRNDRIGDLVLTQPAFEAVRRAWPQAHVAALVSPYAGPLLAGSHAIDELLIDDPADSAGQLARRLKPMRFDAAVVFNSNTRNCLAVWLSGIGQRVCWAFKGVGFLFGNRRVALHRSHPPVHEAEFALTFARRLGATAQLAELAPRLEIDAATKKRVAQRIERELGTSGPLFGVHPGSKNSAFNWPADHYAELVGRLAQSGRVMVTGSAAEEPLMKVIRLRLSDAIRRRVGFYSDFQLLELAAAISAQTVLTVSSTGPMHIAGIVGTPVVALFSPHPAHVPAKWAPLGTNHTLLIAPLDDGEDPRVAPERGAALMARIGVERVLVANLSYVRPGLAAGAVENDPQSHPVRAA